MQQQYTSVRPVTDQRMPFVNWRQWRQVAFDWAIPVFFLLVRYPLRWYSTSTDFVIVLKFSAGLVCLLGHRHHRILLFCVFKYHTACEKEENTSTQSLYPVPKSKNRIHIL